MRSGAISEVGVPMAEVTLKATTGRELGSGPSKRLRVDGKVPAVVYGLDQEPVAVTVEWRSLREALITDAGLNVLIDLDIDGDVALTIVKELQRHPIRGNVLHVDFLRVSADTAITIEVPVLMQGEPKAVERENGVVDLVLTTLAVSAKPSDIPNEIVIDISGLEIGTAIRVADVVLPAGVTTDVDAEETVVNATFGDTVEEEAPAEGEDGEAAAPAED